MIRHVGTACVWRREAVASSATRAPRRSAEEFVASLARSPGSRIEAQRFGVYRWDKFLLPDFSAAGARREKFLVGVSSDCPRESFERSRWPKAGEGGERNGPAFFPPWRVGGRNGVFRRAWVDVG